jgi:hypothetical protein
MNRTSDRETRLVALETRIQEIADRQDILAARMDRVDELQIRMASILLKLNRELGAQRERYPLE